MKIPILPTRQNMLVDENGQMNKVWYLFFSQLNQELQQNVSQEGTTIPSQTASDIATIQAANPVSSIISNKKNGDVYLSINGVFEKITTTPISLEELA